jgi:hypothetical protein
VRFSVSHFLIENLLYSSRRDCADTSRAGRKSRNAFRADSCDRAGSRQSKKLILATSAKLSVRR